MGLDFLVNAIAWPDQCAPDWDSLLSAATQLPYELAVRVDDEHQLRELGLEERDEIREAAASEVTNGIKGLRAALSLGARHLTVVQPIGWTVLLDGGVSAGAEPTRTWYWTEALAVTGLLGQSLQRYADTDPPPAVPRRDQPWANELAPINGPPRLMVVAFPDVINWDRARSVTPDDELSLVERLREVLEGSYSRRAAVLRCGGTPLLLGDRADPTGVVNAVSKWQASGVLDAIGARVLEDIRQTKSTAGEPS